MTGEARADPATVKYARLARRYDARWARYIEASLHETLERLPLDPGGSLLDVGCGTGQLLARLERRDRSLRLWGVDQSAAMLEVARTRLSPLVTLSRAEAVHLPLRSDSMDVVVSTNVFHYVRWPRPALLEWLRVLRPGGRLVVTDWCDDYLACKLCDRVLRVVSRAHVQTYTTRECDALLRAASATEIEIARYRITWWWGLMTARTRKGSP